MKNMYISFVASPLMKNMYISFVASPLMKYKYFPLLSMKLKPYSTKKMNILIILHGRVCVMTSILILTQPARMSNDKVQGYIE